MSYFKEHPSVLVYTHLAVLLAALFIPLYIQAESTNLTPKPLIFETDNILMRIPEDPIEVLVRKIIEANTKTTSTTTATTTASSENVEFKEKNTIETSTTTLSIDAPLIKVWQSEGGITKNLSLGNKNRQVLILQGALNAFVPEYKGEYLSGYFGQKTLAALKQFQKEHSITPSGTVGQKTRDLINKLYLADLCPKREGIDQLFQNLDRKQSIAEDYVPPNLVQLTGIRTSGIVCLSEEPARRLKAMFDAAKKSGHNLTVLSGYRRFEVQKLLKSWSTQNKVSDPNEATGLAEAGHSEHQLGTTVDLSGKSLSYKGPDTAFGRTPEGIWLQQNSYKFGFIMSYPKGKESLTGYIYEPWHFRFVGIDNATDIFKEQLTIQEYLNLLNEPTKSVQN